MFMNPQLALTPVLISFVVLPLEDAESLLARWYPLAKIVVGDFAPSREEIVDLVIDEIQSKDFQKL
jgi:hypothetical protein